MYSSRSSFNKDRAADGLKGIPSEGASRAVSTGLGGGGGEDSLQFVVVVVVYVCVWFCGRVS